MKKTTTVRYDENLEKTLNAIDERPTTAAQNALQIFAAIRSGVLAELKGFFNREEIIAMADAWNGTLPTWQFMANTKMFFAHMEDAETLEGTITRQGAKTDQLLAKIEKLTPAQTAILQLELYVFWNNGHTDSYGSPTPDLDKLVEKLG